MYIQYIDICYMYTFLIINIFLLLLTSKSTAVKNYFPSGINTIISS